MDIKGVVKSKNADFYTVILDYNLTIHFAKYAVQTNNYQLPKIGSEILIKNAQIYPSKSQVTHVVVCKDSEIKTEFQDGGINLWLKKINPDITGMDLLQLVIYSRFIKEHLEYGLNTVVHNRLIESVTKMAENLQTNEDSPVQTADPCIKQIPLPKLNLKTASMCRFVDRNNSNYTDIHQYYHGTHHSEFDDVLIGKITLESPYANGVKLYYLFLHSKGHLQLLLINCKDLNKIINKFVLIRNYVIITEVFTEGKRMNYEYCLVDFKDIHPVEDKIVSIPIMHKIFPANQKPYANKIKFYVKSKSSIYKNGKDSELHLIVTIFEKNKLELDETCYLILTNEHVQFEYYLFENEFYSLHYNSLTETKIDKMKIQINPEKHYYVPKNVIFCEEKESKIDFQAFKKEMKKEKMLTVSEVKNILTTNINSEVSFCGVIREKFLNDAKYHEFGSGIGLASKNHQVSLYEDDPINPENKNSIRLYLNDWNRKGTPFGLIPHMRVIVRNVVVGNKYFKNTGFTRIEVVGYEPPYKFESTNMRSDEGHFKWGKPDYLGKGNQIPWRVRIWSEVTNHNVQRVTMSYKCSNCKVVLTRPGDCHVCKNSNRDLDLYMLVFVSDPFGQSVVTMKSEKMLRMLLQFTEAQFKSWLKAFEWVGELSFNKYDDAEKFYDNTPADLFKKTFRDLMFNINNYGISRWGLKCLKKYQMKKVVPRPDWVGLDAYPID